MIIVTGGAGFIGSALLHALDGDGRGDLVLCDTFGSDDKWRNTAKRNIAEIVRPADLIGFVEAHARDIEIIFHMGAISATTERDVDRIVDNNVRLTLDLIEVCTRHQLRLVYASSAATYGDGSAGFADLEDPEGLAALRPLNPYGWSKHVVDRRVAVLKASGRPLPPQLVGLKFFNVYGPNEYHKGDMSSVVFKLHTAISAGEPARLFKSYHPAYADGAQERDFLWVGDAVAVMQWFLGAGTAVSGLFNVGAGVARTWLDLANAVYDAMGIAADIQFVDMPESLRDRYQYHTRADMTKLARAGFPVQNMLSLEDGVRSYCRTLSNRDDPYL